MKKSLLFILLGTACSTEGKITSVNATPEIAIFSHETGEEVLEGYVITFNAIVNDDDHPTDVLTVKWTSNQRTLCDGVLPNEDGQAECSVVMELGESGISAQVTDPAGASAITSIDVEVLPTEAPSANIVSPTDEEVHYENRMVTFSALINDAEDEPVDLAYSWLSSIDGDLPATSEPSAAGLIEEGFLLSEGEHIISLSVVDQTGKSATETTEVRVLGPNVAPTCLITSPTSQEVFLSGEEILFLGTAQDLETGPADLNISWTSDVDGFLGQGLITSTGEVTVSFAGLSAGVHEVTFTVEDGVEESCSDSVEIAVGTPPAFTLTSPIYDGIFSEGDAIAFEGTLIEIEDPMDQVVFSWFSDNDGEFSTQGADALGIIDFGYSGLSVGLHTITVMTTDLIGFSDTDTIVIRVNNAPSIPSVSLSPDPAYTTDDITAVAVGSTDVDGDTVTYQYEWWLNGVSTMNTGLSVPNVDTNKDELWTVRVTPTDGYQEGAYAEASIIISNSATNIDSISLTPAQPNVTDTLTCNVSVTDVDNDPLTETYQWENGTTGLSLGSLDTLSLSNAIASPGDIISCTYSVDDGQSTNSTPAFVYVANTGPTITEVLVTPQGASINTVLTCSMTVDDPDQQGFTESYIWTNTTSGLALGTGSTLLVDSTLADPFDEIECTATATDPSGAIGNASDSIQLTNQDPLINSITFSNLSPLIGDVVTCIPDAVDPDDDVLTYTYEWYNQTTQSLLGAAEDVLLDASTVVGGNEIACTVVAMDPFGATAELDASFTLGNSLPVIDSIVLSDTFPESTDTIDCIVTASDADGDALVTSIAWVNENTQVTIGTGASLVLSPLSVQPGDSLRCDVQVFDGTDTVMDSVYGSIANTDPSIVSLAIIPNNVFLGDSVTCTAVVDEPDLELYTATYQWANLTQGAVIGSAMTLNVDASQVDPMDEIQCAVAIADASGSTVSDATSIVVGNRGPNIDALTLSSSSLSIGDSIQCASTVTDPEGDIPLVQYEWSNATVGSTIGSTALLTLNASMATGGDEIVCSVTATDSYGESVTQNTSIFVDSSEPVFIVAASISPNSSVYLDSVLTCSGSAQDPDGGTVTYSYQWENQTQNTLLGSNTSLSLDASLANPTDSLSCTIVGTDPNGDNATSTSNVAVDNAAPMVGNVLITPQTNVLTDSTLTCSGTLTDVDQEGLSLSYEWFVAGNSIGTGDSITLDSGLVQPGQNLSCVASVLDNYGAFASDSSTVSVGGYAPVISSISIEPSPYYNDSSLVCSVVATDADNQSLTESYIWTNLTTGSTLSSSSTVTLSSVTASPGDVLLCQVSVSDSSGETDSTNSQVTLDNRAPLTPVVSISPSPAYYDSTLSCTASSSEPDLDSVIYTYEWSVNGILSGETTSSFAGAFVSGDTVVCSVTASDNTLESSAGTGSITISNGVPTVSSVSLSPDPAYVADSLVATAIATDPEGDSLTFQYDWYVNSLVQQSSTSNTFASFVKGDLVEVSVIANDGSDDSQAVTSSITISNTVPGAPSISVSPVSPIEAIDDLVCTIDVNSIDEDSADTVTYTFSWDVDGSEYLGSTTSGSSSTVLASNTVSGEVWTCVVTPNDGSEDGIDTTASVTIVSDWEGLREFTACTSTGRNGPSQGDCDGAYAGDTLENEVTVTSGIQYWTVPADGVYYVEIGGAQGGGIAGDTTRGGRGAVMTGEFTFTEGDVLKILVGQQGSTRPGGDANSAGSGGGGTFLTTNGNTPLIIAGGGGGSGSSTTSNGDATTSTTANAGNSSAGAGGINGGGGGGGQGGSAGNGSSSGGNGSSCSYGPGGGGFYSHGGANCSGSSPYNYGESFVNGGDGGLAESANGGVEGGFGCGSGVGHRAGGGGGYSGGGGDGGSGSGGGGGSYNSGTNQVNTAGSNSGDGYVFIDKY